MRLRALVGRGSDGNWLCSDRWLAVMTAEPLPSAVRPQRLTDVLRRAGVLEHGRVSSVEVLHSRTTVLSRITRVRLTYEGNVSGAPSSLFLKTGLPERV